MSQYSFYIMRSIAIMTAILLPGFFPCKTVAKSRHSSSPPRRRSIGKVMRLKITDHEPVAAGKKRPRITCSANVTRETALTYVRSPSLPLSPYLFLSSSDLSLSPLFASRRRSTDRPHLFK